MKINIFIVYLLLICSSTKKIYIYFLLNDEFKHLDNPNEWEGSSKRLSKWYYNNGHSILVKETLSIIHFNND